MWFLVCQIDGVKVNVTTRTPPWLFANEQKASRIVVLNWIQFEDKEKVNGTNAIPTFTQP